MSLCNAAISRRLPVPKRFPVDPEQGHNKQWEMLGPLCLAQKSCREPHVVPFPPPQNTIQESDLPAELKQVLKDVHSNRSIRYIFASNCPQIHKLHLKQKSPIKQSFENTYFVMVAKYGNKIPLMKTQISGICCNVSTFMALWS